MKLLLDEPGSHAARDVWRDAGFATSSVALLAETRAALASARRSQRVTEDEHFRAVRALEGRWVEMEGIDVTETIALRAGDLADQCALRGYDAIHLASAEAILDRGDVMVVSDVRLAEAAATLGIEALVPAES